MFPRDPHSPDAILASFDADSIRRFPLDPNAPTDDPTWHFAMAAERRDPREFRKGDSVRVDFPHSTRPRFGTVEYTYADGATVGVRYAEHVHTNVLPTRYVTRIGR